MHAVVEQLATHVSSARHAALFWQSTSSSAQWSLRAQFMQALQVPELSQDGEQPVELHFPEHSWQNTQPLSAL